VACLVSWSFSWFNLGKQCFLVVGVSAAVVWTAAHFSPQNSKSPALEVRGWESAAQQPRSLSRRQPDPERKSFARGIAVEAELALPAGRRNWASSILQQAVTEDFNEELLFDLLTHTVRSDSPQQFDFPFHLPPPVPRRFLAGPTPQLRTGTSRGAFRGWS
jgi:hypothetical protein